MIQDDSSMSWSFQSFRTYYPVIFLVTMIMTPVIVLHDSNIGSLRVIFWYPSHLSEIH
jgi:hypothetical protein